MKLSSVDYFLDWPVSIKLKNLREFIITNLEKKGFDGQLLIFKILLTLLEQKNLKLRL